MGIDSMHLQHGFAKSIPIDVIFMATPSISSGWLAPPLWHFDAGWEEGVIP
jgi:hypothetical protein